MTEKHSMNKASKCTWSDVVFVNDGNDMQRTIQKIFSPWYADTITPTIRAVYDDKTYWAVKYRQVPA